MLSLTLKNLRANVTRLLATAVAVIAGTAFVAAGLVITQAVGNAVSGNVEMQYGDVDAAITPVANVSQSGEVSGGLLGGVPAEVLKEVRGIPEVTAAAGELASSTKLLDGHGDALRSQMLGRTWIDDSRLNPFTVVRGSAPDAAGEIAVDRGTAERFGIQPGDRYHLATPSGPVEATVVGITAFGRADSVDGGGTVFFSAGEGLRVLGAGSQQWDQVLLRTDGPTNALLRAVRPTLPSTTQIVSGATFRSEQVQAAQDFLDFLRPLLLGFAFLALFVAGFVIYNTFSVVVTQRSRELALIRSIGATPAQVRRSLLGEGLILGAAASLVGLGAGVLFSLGVQWLLRRLDLPIPSAGLALSPRIVFITVVAGTLITALAVMIPAFRAGRTKPVEAMRAAEVDHSGTSRIRMWVGGLLLGAGIAMLMTHRFGTHNGYLLGFGTLSLFLGVVVGGPLLARLFAMTTRRIFGWSLTARLASDNLARNPKRSATTANALVIGLFLVTVVTVSGTAFRDWATAELAKLSTSDYLVTGATPVPDKVLSRIRKLDGVRTVAPVRSATVSLADGGTESLSGADIDDLIATTGLSAQSGSLREVANGEGVAIGALSSASTATASASTTGSAPKPDTSPTTTGDSTSTTAGNTTIAAGEPGPDAQIGGAATADNELGGMLRVVSADGTHVDVPVVAVQELKLDTIFLGTLANDELFARLVGNQPVRQVYIRSEPDRVDQVGTQLDALLDDYTGLEALPGNFIGQFLSNIIDFLIAAVNGLLALSVIIALIGIVNTMNLSIHERRRELGMVRALGMTKSQVRAMVRGEAFMVGILGTVIGTASGVFLGWIVVGSVTESAVSLNWGRVGIICGVGVIISVLASLLPARRAVKVEMLEAMAST